MAWDEIEAWRRSKRRELLALRQPVAPAHADEIRGVSRGSSRTACRA